MGNGAVWHGAEISTATIPTSLASKANHISTEQFTHGIVPAIACHQEQMTHDLGQRSSGASLLKEPVQWTKEITEVPTPRSAALSAALSVDGATPRNNARRSRIASFGSDGDMDDGGDGTPDRRDTRSLPCIKMQEGEGEHESPPLDVSEKSPYEETAPLDDESRAFLENVMRNHFLFDDLPEELYESAFAFIQKTETREGQVIFSQGDIAGTCYFIQSGTYSVFIDGEYVSRIGANQTFGELALINKTTRAATVTCSTDGLLWKMGRRQFSQCMKFVSSLGKDKATEFFKSDSHFRCLDLQTSHKGVEALVSICKVLHFRPGEVIVHKGDITDTMLIVISGHPLPDESYDTDMRHSFSLDHIIGGAGLIYGKRPSPGYVALDSVVCLAIGSQPVKRLEGFLAGQVLSRIAIKSLLAESKQMHPESQILALTDDQLNRLIGQFEDATLEANELVFDIGDPAQLVIVIDGEVAIYSDQSGTDVESVLTAGMFIGEAELFSGNAMTQRMIVSKRSRVHRVLLSRAQMAFGEPLSEVVRCNSVRKVLQDIFLFKNLTAEQIDTTVRNFQVMHFPAKKVVVREGDDAKHFFLIQQGSLVVKKNGTVLRTLGRWDYFGERGLLLQEKRSATCQTLEKCACLVLDADTFFEIVGNFRKELERRMQLQDLNITINDLQCVAVVGRGTFGTVRLIHHKQDSNKMYALKAVKKLEVVRGKQQKSIVMEMEVNKQCYHPCIMQFIKTFRDKDHVYFLTEFLGGGDLFCAIREIGSLTTLQSQFFSGSIALALEYLHARSIMYRDLKPENVLLELNGAAKLVDFGCCKKTVRTNTLVGTPDYLAPEVIKQKFYTCSCDWWSLGVMVHEFVVGPLPFGGDCEDQMSLFRAICDEPLVFPKHMTDAVAQDLIASLLERKPDRRLCSSSRGAKDLKEHGYYKDFNWHALAGGFHEPPYKPDEIALKKMWEPSDGDLAQNVGSSDHKTSKDMEWSLVF